MNRYALCLLLLSLSAFADARDERRKFTGRFDTRDLAARFLIIDDP